MVFRVEQDVISKGLIEAAKATWPNQNNGQWHAYDNGKLVSKTSGIFSSAVKLIIPEMIKWVDSLGITGESFPDIEYFHGAGLHQMGPGNYLGLHTDCEFHPLLPWKREWSIILYLDDCEGGELDIVNEDGTVAARIPSKCNTLAMFSTPNQLHRVNETKNLRRTICLFYWSICDKKTNVVRANFSSEQDKKSHKEMK